MRSQAERPAAEGETAQARALLSRLKTFHPDAERNLYKSLHNVSADTFPGFTRDGKYHFFLDEYE